MNTRIVGLLAETSIHPGAGQSSGIIDLPVAREAATDYPFVPGSSVKGALLGLARSRANWTERSATVFLEKPRAATMAWRKRGRTARLRCTPPAAASA